MTEIADLVVSLEFNDKNSTVVLTRAGQELRRFSAELRGVNEALVSTEGHHVSMARGFRNFMVTIAATRFALMDFNQVFLSLPRAAMNAGKELERLQVLMKGLSKETTEAKRNAEGIANTAFVIKSAQNAPFEIKAIADAFVKLKVAGIDPTTGSLHALMDGIAKFGGDSDTLKRASVAIMQMAGKGVISMEELRQQLGEAMPTAMRDMAEGLGMTVEQLTIAVSKGTVKALPALQRLFLVMKAENAGAAEAMMETWVGFEARFKTQWMLLLNDVYQSGFADEMKSVGRDIMGALKGDDMKQAAVAIGHGLRDAIQIIRDLGEAAKNAWPMMKLMGEGLLVLYAGGRVKAIVDWFTTLKGKIDLMAAADAARLKEKIRTETEAIGVERAAQAKRLALYREQEVAQVAHLNEMALREKVYHEELLAIQARLNPRGTQMRRANGTFASVAETTAAMEAARLNAALAREGVTAQQAVTAATRQQIAATEAMVAQTTAATVALEKKNATLLKGAKSASLMTGALNFIGGPLGALTLALSVIIPLWMEFGNRGQEAIDKIHNAMDSKTGNRETVDLIDQQIAERKKGVERLQKTLADRKNGAVDGATKSTGELENELMGMKASLAYFESKRGEALRQARANETAKMVQIEDEAAQAKLTQLSRVRNAAAAKADEDAQRDIDKMPKSSAALIEKRLKQAADEKTRANVAFFKGQLEQVTATRDKVIAALTDLPEGSVRDAKTELLDKLNVSFTQASEQLKQSLNLGNSVGAIKEKTGQESAFERMLRGLKARAEEARLEVTGVTTEVAKAQAAFKNWKPEKDGKKPTLDQQNDAIDQAASIDRDKELIAVRRELEQVTQGAESKIASMAASLEGEGSSAAKLTAKIESMTEGTRVWNLETLTTLENLTALRDRMAKLEEEGRGKRLTELSEDIRAAAGVNRAALQTEEQRLRATMEAEAQAWHKKIDLAKANDEERRKLEADYADWLLARTERLAFDMEGPLAKLTRNWLDMNQNLKEASADWAREGLDAIMAFCTKGENRFGQFVQKILEDLLRIQLQARVMAPLNNMLNGFINGFMTPGNMTDLSGGHPFAKGGVMTPDGVLPLQRYAYGGVAKSPQVAIFGEGRQNEAYVPLPDGRSIPVTVKGGMPAPAVTVNVINQSGQAVEAKQQGGPRFDGQQLILDVVLTAAQRPGAFRDGLKGAVK